MELLFAKESFSSEFKDLLGFVDADMRFARLKSSLQSATDEIIDLIGEQTYKELCLPNANKDLLELVKYAVALKGYIIYAPTADLSVTNNGRLMRRDEHMVSAFEWQIESNDEGLENLFYRHLDRLLKYMIKNGISINTKKYNSSNLFVNSIEKFENIFNIDGSHLLFFKLIPALREFDKLEVLPRVGKEIFNERDSISEDLRHLIEIAGVNYAMAWGIRRLNIRLFPKGVLQYSKTGSANKKQGAKLEYLETAMVFEKDADKYLLKIEEKIASNKKVTNETKEELDLPLGFGADDGFVDL
ncbi:DUF6712 family protein [Riemerella anatipestifer]|uniref:Uncharacterized protein n=1 Tax=Riemerella anatipestifer RA-CH-1 TaxID=1228997 RepID=J9R849_RIEAN|nr:DUF6712 family protein [Riemerella anatipestifer]AFR35902.1 hypothetical protein B739_1304 [Riemerella anatipestifer RA-CH-1]MCU7581587.1 hypothetical protein [Riemerella anatipestifer]MDD1548749.1 hypothetical protein [Riemerella anatipestifer]MDD1550135.1 hypothetical protein [Riemerella anatipestifer]MDR7831832.1 hypothetical protein [Riemerella anatipestifer]